MKTRFVVIENKTKFKLVIYYRHMRGDYLHVAVTIHPAEDSNLQKHEKYLLSPSNFVSIKLSGWTNFKGIKFDTSRVRNVCFGTEEKPKPSEGSYNVTIYEKLN